MHWSSTAAGVQGQASGEETRRVPGWRARRKREMVELQNHGNRDVGQAAVSLRPDAGGTHTHILESSQPEGPIEGTYCVCHSTERFIIIQKKNPKEWTEIFIYIFSYTITATAIFGEMS